MENVWPMVPLGEVLTRSEEQLEIQPDQQYRQVTVRLWGGGVVLRNEVSGARISARKRQVVRSQQFVLSRIDARNGAFGLVPDFLDGAIVSNDFPSFEINKQRLEPRFLEWMSKTRRFVNLCQAASEGTTNRVRLKVDRFLAMAIPLPPLDEQRRIVARIEELAAPIEEARELRAKARGETKALLDSTLQRFFEQGRRSAWPHVPVEKLCTFGPQNGLFKTKDYFGDGTLLLNVADAYKGLEVSIDTLERVAATDDEVEKYRLVPGDVCIVRSSIKDEGIGRACVFSGAPEPVVFECHLMRLRLDPQRVEPRLFTRFFNSSIGKEQILSTRRASVMTTINQKDVKALTFPVPPLDEQRHMITRLDDLQAQVDELTALQDATQAELDALLPSVLDRAFRGEL